jgi:phage-related holin
VFLSPIRELIFATGVLLVIDFALGVLASQKKGIKFNSRDAKKTIIKMAVYQVAILTGFLLDRYFVPGNLIVRVVMMAIGLVESQSIFENIYTLTGLNVWGALKTKLVEAISASTKKPQDLDRKPVDHDDSGK